MLKQTKITNVEYPILFEIFIDKRVNNEIKKRISEVIYRQQIKNAELFTKSNSKSFLDNKYKLNISMGKVKCEA